MKLLDVELNAEMEAVFNAALSKDATFHAVPAPEISDDCYAVCLESGGRKSRSLKVWSEDFKHSYNQSQFIKNLIVALRERL